MSCKHLLRTINLDLPQNRRWDEVIQQDLAAARLVVDEARAQMAGAGILTRLLILIVAPIFGLLTRLWGGPYADELRAWARALGLSFGTVALATYGYELGHLPLASRVARLWGAIFGCTSAACQPGQYSPLLLRNLDWDLKQIGPATGLFRFTRTLPDGSPHTFFAVGFPAFVGVLSGMVPGGYAVTINWMMPVERPGFSGYGTAMLLRRTLEQCRTYDEAVKMLSTGAVASSVFYTVCGVKPGEACVIERSRHAAAVRPMHDGLEVQTNHNIDPQYADNNTRLFEANKTMHDLLVDSTLKRREVATAVLSQAMSVGTEQALLEAMAVPPVCNGLTVQRMCFDPKAGRVVIEHPTSIPSNGTTPSDPTRCPAGPWERCEYQAQACDFTCG